MEIDLKNRVELSHLKNSEPGMKIPEFSHKKFDSNLKNFESGETNQLSNETVKDTNQVNSFKCPICQIDFDSRRKIDEHFVTDHDGIKPYHCSLCDARFSKRRILTVHVSKVHNRKTDHLCDFCGKSYNHKHDLKRHVLAVHYGEENVRNSKAHQCQICGSRFSYDSCLQRHIKRIHEHKMPEYKCSSCDGIFSTKATLIYHTDLCVRAKNFLPITERPTILYSYDPDQGNIYNRFAIIRLSDG